MSVQSTLLMYSALAFPSGEVEQSYFGKHCLLKLGNLSPAIIVGVQIAYMVSECATAPYVTSM